MGGFLPPAAPQMAGGALPTPAPCPHWALPPKLSPAAAPSCERMRLGWKEVSHSILPPFSQLISFDRFPLDLGEMWGYPGEPCMTWSAGLARTLLAALLLPFNGQLCAFLDLP